MFDRLFDFLARFGGEALPAFVVPVYQNAAVLRFGKYHRTATPGFHWKIPFVDEVYKENVFLTTVRLQPQTLTTKDGASVVVAGVVKYQVVDVQPYLSRIGDQHDLLIDTAMGAILRAVRDVDYEALLSDPPELKIASAIRRAVKPFGVDIEAFTFTDLGRVRTIRLMTHTPLILDN